MSTKLDRRSYVDGTQTAQDGTPVNFDGRFSVAGSHGVAFYLLGWAQEWTEERWILACGNEAHIYEPDSDDADETEDTHGAACYLYDEPQQVDDRTRVVAVMVGDDRQHTVDVGDLAEIDPDTYCSECGQIGCEGDFRHA